MTLESLIADRDRIATELREANQRICDEFNRLYPVGETIMARSWGAYSPVFVRGEMHVDRDSLVCLVEHSFNRYSTMSIEYLQPIQPQEAKT